MHKNSSSLVAALMMLVAIPTWAQASDDGATPAPSAPTAKVTATPPAPSAGAATTKIKLDDTWENWPARYSQYIGYEAAAGAASIIGQNIIVYGWWDKDRATEIFFGFTKGADNYNETNSTTTGASSSTTTSSTTGAKNPYVLTVGAGQNYRFNKNKWIQIYGGYFGGVTYTTGTSYSTGSTATSVANTATPGNYTVSYANTGTISQNTDLLLFAGGKLGAEFYLKWFPNLALGFASGLMTTVGGTTTTQVDSQSGTDTYVGGVKQTPSPVNSTSSSTKTTPGLTASTFGIGGTIFQLTGAFTLRYVW